MTNMFIIEDLRREERKATTMHKRYLTLWLKEFNANGGLVNNKYHVTVQKWADRIMEIRNQILMVEDPEWWESAHKKDFKKFFTVRVVEEGYTQFLDEKCSKLPLQKVVDVVLKRKGKSNRSFIDAQACTVFILNYKDQSLAHRLEVDYTWQEEKVREEVLSIAQLVQKQ